MGGSEWLREPVKVERWWVVVRDLGEERHSGQREGTPGVKPLDKHHPRDESWSECSTMITESRYQIESRCQIAL